MSLKIPVKFVDRIKVKKSPEEVYAYLSKIENIAPLVPGIDEFKKVKKDVYRWKFKPMGMKGVSVVLEYDTTFSFKENEEIMWNTVEGSGNAEMTGKVRIKKLKGGTELDVEIEMTPDLPVPSMFRKLAEPFVKSEFERMMGIFAKRVKEALE